MGHVRTSAACFSSSVTVQESNQVPITAVINGAEVPMPTGSIDVDTAVSPFVDAG